MPCGWPEPIATVSLSLPRFAGHDHTDQRCAPEVQNGGPGAVVVLVARGRAGERERLRGDVGGRGRLGQRVVAGASASAVRASCRCVGRCPLRDVHIRSTQVGRLLRGWVENVCGSAYRSDSSPTRGPSLAEYPSWTERTGRRRSSLFPSRVSLLPLLRLPPAAGFIHPHGQRGRRVPGSRHTSTPSWRRLRSTMRALPKARWTPRARRSRRAGTW